MTLLLILSRALHIGACLLLFGCVAIRLLIGWRETLEMGATRQLSRLCLACLFTAAGSGMLWLWVAIAGMSGLTLRESLSAPLFQMVLTQTTPGQDWLARCAMIATLFPLIFFSRPRWTWLASAIIAALLVASLARLGHAGAAGNAPVTFLLAADGIHLLAAGLWPGGLLPFALVLKCGLRAESLEPAHVAVRRFSALSLVAVSLLTLSGIVTALSLVGSFGALVATGYGRLLCVKLALFAAAISLGAWNFLIHKPHFTIAQEARAAMLAKVWVEAAMGAFIVLLVAILGTLPPATAP